MNVNEAERLKSKFDDLMRAAEAFGTESQQLSQTNKDLNGLIHGFQNLGLQLSAMAAQCQEYLDTVDHLVSGSLAQQAQQDVSEVSKTARQCREQAETLTALYQKTVGDFLGRVDTITARHNAAARAVQEAEKEVRAAGEHLEALLNEEHQRAEENAKLREALRKYLEASGYPLS